MRRKLMIGLVGGLAVAAAGAFGYFELVKAGVLKYNEYDRRERGALAKGDLVPDLTLSMYDGSTVQLSQLWDRPLFLVFGSCT